MIRAIYRKLTTKDAPFDQLVAEDNRMYMAMIESVVTYSSGDAWKATIGEPLSQEEAHTILMDILTEIHPDLARRLAAVSINKGIKKQNKIRAGLSEIKDALLANFSTAEIRTAVSLSTMIDNLRVDLH